jgi:hypothetical protein
LQERKFFLSPAMTSFAIAFDDEEETTGIINPQYPVANNTIRLMVLLPMKETVK